jgi:phenylacetate-CoA ligase
MIAQYMERNNIFLDNLGLTSAVANSEYLNPYTKTTLGKHLNTQILSRYSSEEIGIIAQQTLNSPNSFVINHASYVVEVLQFDNNESVKPGEFGRIVVTDLFNFAMPIIRYDTGDIAKLGINDEGVIQLDEIEGRKMDVIYDSDGNLISSFVVYTKFYKYYHLLKQYQFIQQSEKDYEVKLNLQGNTFAFEDDLIAIIKSDFGEDSNVTITYVDEIPPLSSGKRRKVVNNYKKS